MSARFAEPADALTRLLRTWKSDGAAQSLTPPVPAWPEGRRLVLGADTALDLGNPTSGSRAFLLWDATENPGDVHLVGADVPALLERGDREVSLGLVIRVQADFDEEYDAYLDLKEALYGVALDGLTLRSMPSQSHLWLRLHRDAAEGGFSLAHLGAALVDTLGAVEGVSAVQVVFVTDDAVRLAALAPLADDVQRRVAALVKRHEEVDAECDECEYQDICDEKEHMS